MNQANRFEPAQKQKRHYTRAAKFGLTCCFLLLLLDRGLVLYRYSFTYTDLDQMIAWNCAVDYAQGIFHEPFFYGQAYNYMLESFLAVPQIWMGIPPYMALPITTTLLSLLPILYLARVFWRKNQVFWACLVLCIPTLLPLEFSMLTSMSRGFIQAYFVLPLLFYVVLVPEGKYRIPLFFIGSGAGFFLNPGSLLLLFPIGIWLFWEQIRNWKFYLNVLWVLPFFLLDWWAKQFYVTHPQHDMFPLNGVSLDAAALLQNLQDTELFQYLFPIMPGWGFVYPYLFLLLAIYCFWKKHYREMTFALASLFILLISLSVPKTLVKMEDTWVFFTPSRLFLCLPLLFFLSLWLSLRHLKTKRWMLYTVLAISATFVWSKALNGEEQITTLTSKTTFAVPKITFLQKQVQQTKKLAQKHEVGLVLNGLNWRWDPVYLNLAYYPITRETKPVVSMQRSERRTWLFEENKDKHFKNVLLYSFELDSTQLAKHQYQFIPGNYLLIKNNNLKTSELMKSLNLPYSRY